MFSPLFFNIYLFIIFFFLWLRVTNYVPPQKTKIKGVLGVETRKIKQPINEFLLKINGKKKRENVLPLA